MCIGLRVYYPLFFTDFNENLIFSMHFGKIPKYQISLKILPVGAELFHADGQTDKKHEANTVAFSNVAKAPRNHTVT